MRDRNQTSALRSPAKFQIGSPVRLRRPYGVKIAIAEERLALLSSTFAVQRGRKFNREDAAFAGKVTNCNFAIQGLNSTFDNRKPKADTWLLLRATTKRLEYVVQLIFRYTSARVFHFDHDVFVLQV